MRARDPCAGPAVVILRGVSRNDGGGRRCRFRFDDETGIAFGTLYPFPVIRIIQFISRATLRTKYRNHSYTMVFILPSKTRSHRAPHVDRSSSCWKFTLGESERVRSPKRNPLCNMILNKIASALLKVKTKFSRPSFRMRKVFAVSGIRFPSGLQGCGRGLCDRLALRAGRPAGSGAAVVSGRRTCTACLRNDFRTAFALRPL